MADLKSKLSVKMVMISNPTWSILLTMILGLAVATLGGCLGITSPAKSSSPPNPTALRIATTLLNAGSVEASYSGTLIATGGVPPYAWKTTGGEFPPGLQLNALTGTIAGTPTLAGSYTFTAEVRDTKTSAASAFFALGISPAPTPTVSVVLPNSGPTGGGTAVTISGSNFRSGAGVQFGKIPATSVIVANSTEIQAVVPAESSGSVPVAVWNSGSQGATATNAFTFLAPPLRIETTSFPVGMMGASYSTTLSAAGGTPGYAWRTTKGALPTGLHLNATSGTIAGTPTQAGSFSFSAQVQDSKANSTSVGFTLVISPDPAPSISGISQKSGPSVGGTAVTISGSNFRSGAVVQFGGIPATSVQVVNSAQIQTVTPTEPGGTVNVTVKDSDGQIATSANAFTFAAQPALSADVIVDASQTVSETGGDDIAAAKNIYASASAPESDGGLYPDWSLISSEFAMKRMRNINGLGDCALDGTGKLTGCSRLNNDLSNMLNFGLTPHVIVGQWAPSSIGGNPSQWGATQWAQYDALCYAIVNYVANQYGGKGFSEVLFEVENEMDTTTDPRALWLTTTSSVAQGDASRFAQFDTVYAHWAKAVDLVATQTPLKKIRIAAPATGFWTVYYGSGQLWHNQIIQKYAAQNIRLDVVSLHIYEGEANDLAKYAQSIRSTLNASGYSKAEIWVSEWGASDQSDSYFGAINGSHQGAAWAIDFLLQALKGTVTGGSFLEVRDNQGHDTAGTSAEMYEASWNHIEKNVEYPKAIANAFSMVARMTGTRVFATTSTVKTDLRAMTSCDATSASLIVANYNYLFDYTHKNYSDLSTNETVTVAFKNLPFNGSVTVDRYLIDSQTSNLNYWVAAGKIPPSVQATQLQKVESFPATATAGALTLPARKLGPSAVSLWIVHQ